MDRRSKPNRSAQLLPYGLGACFLVACHYYDPGLNLAFLLYTLCGLAVVTGCVGSSALTQAISRNGLLGLGCGLTLVALAAHHLLISWSPDSSFVVSLVLATLPVVTLLALTIDAKRLFQFVFICVFFMALYSSCHYLISGARAYGTLLDPNNFGTLLYLALIPWLHSRLNAHANPLRVFGKPLGRASQLALIGGVVGVFVFALLATHSRFGWLALGSIFVFWLLASRFQKIDWWVFAVAFLAAGLALAIYAGIGTEELQANIRSTVTATDADDQSVRLYLLQAAWQMINQLGGFAGTGVYTFSLFYPQYRSVFEQHTPGLFVHNDYVQLLLEGGVLLLLPLIALLVAVIVGTLRITLQRGDWNDRVGYLAALGLACLHANLNFVFYVLPLVFVMGVLLALAFPARAEVSNVSVSQQKLVAIRWCVRGSFLFGLACLFFLLLDVANYGVFGGQKGLPGTASVRGNAERMLQFATLSQQLNERRGIPVLAEATLRERDLLLDEEGNVAQQQEDQVATVLSGYRRAIETDPFNPLAYTALFRFTQKLGQAEEMEALIDQALQLNPQAPNVALLAIDHYESHDKLQKAVAVSVGVGRWCEDIARSNPANLERLGRRMAQLQQRVQDAELEGTLDHCRKSRQYKKESGRTSWLMRWLTQS